MTTVRYDAALATIGVMYHVSCILSPERKMTKGKMFTSCEVLYWNSFCNIKYNFEHFDIIIIKIMTLYSV